MQARQIMTSPVITVRPDTTVRDAATLLLDHQITAAPVLDTDGELLGIISESDLVVDRFSHDPRSQLRPIDDEPPAPQTVAEAMTTPVIALSPSADAADLAHTMLDADIRSIPIVEGATVIGIVSRRDLLRTLIRDDDAIRTEILTRLTSYGTDPHRWDVQVTDGTVLLVPDTHHHTDNDDGRTAIALARTVPGVAAVHLTRQPTPTPS